MRLSVKAVAYTGALLWGGTFLLAALVNLLYPSYGRAFLDLCSSIYPGYHVARTITGVVVGSGYALLDGAVGGALFAWLYNWFAL